MDVAEPPRIVVESRASCTDAPQVSDVLRDALGAARAPRHAWVVKMNVQPTTPAAGPTPATVRAQGDIVDDHGVQVADRILSAPAGDCRGLARAVGVWASLVLEQEVARSQAPPAHPGAQADASSTDSLWPAPEPFVKPPPEGEWYLHHDDTRDVELGVGGFLMSGAGAGAMAGVTPYAIIEAGKGIFLRPAIAIGEALPALNTPPVVHALLVAARFDTCLRIPGLYTRNRGMQVDMCGGTDVGVLRDVTDDLMIPYVSVGPSIDLRGELGSLLSATIRGVAGFNVTSPLDDHGMQPLWSGRVELAFSWKV